MMHFPDLHQTASLSQSQRLSDPPKFRFLYRRSTRLVAMGLVAFACAAGYIILMAAWQSWGDRWTGIEDLLLPRAVDVVIAFWLFYIGSSIGSFLNVVAWRMPRGVSINGRSHCPWCDSTLLWKDNWPVFGWIALGGRCRTCRMPISPRYPIVELAVGLSISFVAWTELCNNGSNLPFHPERIGRVGSLWTPLITRESVIVATYHAVAIAVSWAFGLVRFDDHRLPRRLVMVSFAMLIVPMLVLPALAIVPWQVEMDSVWRPDGKYLDAAMRVITGLAAAVVVGRSLARYVSPTADPKMNPLGSGTARMLDLIAILCVPGIIVGWQAVLGVTVLAVLIAYALPIVIPTRVDSLARLAISMPIALSMQLFFWRPLHEFAYWPSVDTAPIITLSWAAMVLVIPLGLAQKPPRPNDTSEEVV